MTFWRVFEMEEELTHFQYFVDMFWQFFLANIAVRIICGFYGDLMYWINKSFGD